MSASVELNHGILPHRAHGVWHYQILAMRLGRAETSKGRLKVLQNPNQKILWGTGNGPLLAANPSQPMAALVKMRNVTKMTLSKAVRKNLEMKSFCRRRCNILTAISMAIFRERSPSLFNNLVTFASSLTKIRSRRGL